MHPSAWIWEASKVRLTKSWSPSQDTPLECSVGPWCQWAPILGICWSRLLMCSYKEKCSKGGAVLFLLDFCLLCWFPILRDENCTKNSKAAIPHTASHTLSCKSCAFCAKDTQMYLQPEVRYFQRRGLLGGDNNTKYKDSTQEGDSEWVCLKAYGILEGVGKAPNINRSPKIEAYEAKQIETVLPAR